MNAITQKVRKQVMEEAIEYFRGVYGDTVTSRGMKHDIQKLFDIYVRQKINQYYQKLQDLFPLGDTMAQIKAMKADSKIEAIFFDILKKEDIHFKFQFPIGRYRIDFLISDTLVFEIDGPQHSKQKKYDNKRDNYLIKLGYQVMRVESWVIIMNYRAVIEGIREVIGDDKKTNS